MSLITSPVTLVLGAGASIECGYPTARALRRLVTEKLRYLSDPLSAGLRACGYTIEELQSFRRTFERSELNSVDAFLEKNPRYTDLGKHVIAAALLPFEVDERLTTEGDTPRWYNYLFNQIAVSPEKFFDHRIGVVTFNYDRSLEQYLMNAFQAAYGVRAGEADKMLRHLNVVHVHGDLGPPFGDAGRPYLPTLSPEVIKECAGRIRVVHESDGASPEYEAARELVERAGAVCFVGFGFHDENVARLWRAVDRQSQHVFASSWDRPQAERDVIQSRLGIRVRWSSERATAEQSLREFAVLT